MAPPTPSPEGTSPEGSEPELTASPVRSRLGVELRRRIGVLPPVVGPFIASGCIASLAATGQFVA